VEVEKEDRKMPVKGKGKKATRKTATGSGSTVTHTTSPWDSWTDEDLSVVNDETPHNLAT
jgi:hypothetical protein